MRSTVGLCERDILPLLYCRNVLPACRSFKIIAEWQLLIDVSCRDHMMSVRALRTLVRSMIIEGRCRQEISMVLTDLQIGALRAHLAIK